MLHLRQKKARNSTKHITVKYVTPVIIMGAFITGIPGIANAMPLLPVEGDSTITLPAATPTPTTTAPAPTHQSRGDRHSILLTGLLGADVTPVLPSGAPPVSDLTAVTSTQIPTAPIASRKVVKKTVYQHAWRTFAIPHAVAHSPAAKDKRGAEPSLYRGKYFHADQERFRLCVGNREGHFTYMVRGGGGNNYYGTYQFHRDFQNGIPYMMAKESRETGDGLVKDALKLRHIPINKWNRYWQDRGFATVLNYNGKWSGRHHWNGGSHSC